VWQACVDLLDSVVDGDPVEALGISTAGPLDGETAGPINIPEWAPGFGLGDAARERYPDARVEVVLDGACAALGEYAFGAGRGATDLLGMIVSSGVGGGIIRSGTVMGGRTGNAGHIGHIPVPDSTDPCACGGIGCLEAVASGPSSVRWARANGWTGDTGIELARAAKAGDAVAVAALARAGTALGTAIAGAAALLDVDLVVIGGGFALSGARLWDPLQTALRRHAGLRYLHDLDVVPALLGSGASLAGAAALVGDGYRRWPI
jgi:glucokinase